VLDEDRCVQQHAVGGVDGVDDRLPRGLGADIDERRRLDLDIGDVRIGDEDGSGGSTQADERALVDFEHDPPAIRRYLRGPGASEIIDRKELSAPGKPLAKERWAAAIDSVGASTLANALAGTRYGGAVAACGLAGGMDLPTTVAPFILRAVSLLGIDSVMCPLAVRREAWKRLSTDLERGKLQTMTNEIQLPGVLVAAPAILDGRIRGRIVVKIQ